MLATTETFIDDWWASLFDVARADLWRTATVRPHGALGDHPGWFVAWRGDGVRVSVPSGINDDVIATIVAEPSRRLQDVVFWQGFTEKYAGRVIGPGIHHYLDHEPAHGRCRDPRRGPLAAPA